MAQPHPAARCLPDAPHSPAIVGESAAICRLREQIAVAAACEESVLIVGETGTGKELAARAIHAGSRRASKPLSIVNCAAIPPEMIAAELFGHIAGAFTGATHSREGRLRAAAGSSIFLDEITATSNEFQVALLRAVEYGEVQPVGADGPPRKVDVRYIAASNASPWRLRHHYGDLRKDLFYRLTGIVIEMPPLRDHPEDIPALAEHFLYELSFEYGQKKRLGAHSVDELMRRDFPGNVRELRQTVRRAYATCEGDVIRRRHLRHPFAGLVADAPHNPPASSDDETRFTLPSQRDRFLLKPAIRQWIVCALAEAQGNISAAARLLGVPRSTLQHDLLKHRINVDAFRRGAATASTPQPVAQFHEETALSSVPT